jgi:hypothetical protein
VWQFGFQLTTGRCPAEASRSEIERLELAVVRTRRPLIEIAHPLACQRMAMTMMSRGTTPVLRSDIDHRRPPDALRATPPE